MSAIFEWLGDHGWWVSAGAALAVAIFASFAEWRRLKRSDLDRVGFMPWNFITVMAALAALISAAYALL